MAEIEGMSRLLRNFNKVNMRIPNITSRFLDVIGEEALEMLKINTPIDTGQLRDSWILQKSGSEIVVANDQQDLLSLHLFGSIHHPMPRNFVMQVNDVIDREVLNTLQRALAENHRWFSKLL